MTITNPFFSFIIPVFNRPREIRELLESFRELDCEKEYEIVIVEDGSILNAMEVIKDFTELPITYFFKENSGPGNSRNYGMSGARGDYFIILDSDCLLTAHYLDAVETGLKTNPVDFFGGPDRAHPDFNVLQKAISYSMTSFLTTGGIRGSREEASKFQPRSFNMGLSRAAFEASGGFGNIYPGEDPDLTLRLWKMGFKSIYIDAAFVYHKRRISLTSFYKQVRKFGLVRPILNIWHPGSAKITYWFPSLFFIGLVCALLLLLVGLNLPLYMLLVYMLLVGCDAALKNASVVVGGMAIFATLVQFCGYGWGFLESTFMLHIVKKDPKIAFPRLFFD